MTSRRRMYTKVGQKNPAQKAVTVRRTQTARIMRAIFHGSWKGWMAGRTKGDNGHR